MEQWIARLREDRVHIELVLEDLDAALAPLDRERARRDIEALEALLDRHRPDARALFARLDGHAEAVPRWCVRTLEAEHEVESIYVGQVRVFLRLCEERGALFAGPLAESGKRLAAWLRSHLWKEEEFVLRRIGPSAAESPAAAPAGRPEERAP